MIDSPASRTIFDEEFNEIRAKCHHIDVSAYLEHMSTFYSFINKAEEFDEITLWFGIDTFCQINLLTIAAYLDKIGYKGYLYTVLIEDGSYKVIRGKELIIKDTYFDKYIKLMCDNIPVSFMDNYINKAAKEYLDLISDDGEIATLIKNNVSVLSRRELVELVWNKTRKYGLGDVQVFNIIEKYTDYVFNK